NFEGVLVDVKFRVGRGQYLARVDVVDPYGLQELRFNEVADAGFGHDRDRDRVHDRVDHRGVTHPGDTTGRADVGRNALQRHDRDGSGFLGDLGVLDGEDVHDDAALEHLVEPCFQGPSVLGAILVGCGL